MATIEQRGAAICSKLEVGELSGVLHVPERLADSLEEILLEVSAEAKKHGIGVLTFEDPADYATWEERVEPIRRDPEPRKLNDLAQCQEGFCGGPP